jgi:hypothetical protein
MTAHRLSIAALVLGVLLVTGVAQACPTCGEGLMQADPHAQSIAAGYKYSIIFMVTMPYLCLGTLGSIAYYSIRRAKAQQGVDGDTVDLPTAGG